MPNEAVIMNEENETTKFNEEVDALYRRQDELEKEISHLKQMLSNMKEKHSKQVGIINERIGTLEEEVKDIRETLNELIVSVKLIQTGVDNVQKHVGGIDAKQDITINAQDKFISQLWKAFFALLGFITAAGTTIVAFLK